MSYKVDLENITVYKNDATNFGSQLLRLVMKADLANKARLREAFPNAVKTVEVWHQTGEIPDLPYDGMEPRLPPSAEELELLKNFTQEFEVLEGVPFLLETTALHAWSIMSHLQLALRHPLNIGPTSKIARQVADRIIETLAPPGSALRAVADRGWDPHYDSK
ncbi:MAG: hypothetical protein PHU23_04955 [Dehalococcoidales bacterium]|nr:hypothetical protein [Dehalococcoidales bacterium]